MSCISDHADALLDLVFEKVFQDHAPHLKELQKIPDHMLLFQIPGSAEPLILVFCIRKLCSTTQAASAHKGSVGQASVRAGHDKIMSEMKITVIGVLCIYSYFYQYGSMACV